MNYHKNQPNHLIVVAEARTVPKHKAIYILL